MLFQICMTCFHKWNVPSFHFAQWQSEWFKKVWLESCNIFQNLLCFAEENSNCFGTNSYITYTCSSALKSKPVLCFYSTADNIASAGTKRSLSEAKDEDDLEIKDKREGKRARLDGEELEAQIELKITANAGSRDKLEKVCYISYLFVSKSSCLYTAFSRLPTHFHITEWDTLLQ